MGAVPDGLEYRSPPGPDRAWNALVRGFLLSARAFLSADLFAGVILLGVIGYVTALVVALVERKLLVWRSSGH